MILNPINPKKALNKAFRLIKPKRQEIESFKSNLIKLLGLIDEKESEENVKIHLMDFFKNTGFNPDFLVATKGRTDFVIYAGKEAKTPAGILFEVKRPTNKADMVSKSNLNAKAMHELMLYYLRERLIEKNSDIRQLIITNIYEWYIFDVFDFERIFFKNSELVKAFQDWNSGQKVSTNTDLFYNEIAKPFLQQLENEIDFTWFDIRTFEKPLRNESKEDDKELIALFKILSPTHLLKLKSTNDSNSLDKGFYAELLHIIGLEEIKEGSKKLIRRKEIDKRDPASLLENTITILDVEDSLHKVTDIANYGEKREDRLFNVALELCITWINRILFLKLLEAQLIKYHKGDQQYKFLNFTRIPQYDELYKLFFQVLAKRPEDRGEAINKKFANIPYLNSSLFEISELEDQTIKINSLDNSLDLALFSGTVLRDEKNKPVAKYLNGLQYLFDFLEAYDFASEGSEDIQEESKTLINASVLGLIFEKINGYKDGSFFTPGFITMYMCRETIRRAVVQKFNEAKGWNCTEFDQLYNNINDIQEANGIINSLKICDPAVGSGHFLVSALNEIIAVKNDLRILQDRNGKRLKEYVVEVENDELMVSDIDGDMYVYQYLNKESQRVQEALFHEKQTIIESCLFGVDINPNSVKICRLRLWIELLKNAYYIPGSQQLETLPNIDINIKCGNSLISRFALDADLSKALKSIKYNVEQYRGFVNDYKNAHDKELKRGLEQIINTIKTDFRTEIAKNDPKVNRLKKISGELFTLLNQVSIFELDTKQKKAKKLQQEKLETEIEKLSKEVEEIKSNSLYRNAFEWRFEFPEVLDNEGNFVGFDVVIGNPPYIRQEELSSLKSYLELNFKTYAGTADLFVYFIELGLRNLKPNGNFTFIVPNKWMRAGYGKQIRNYVKEYQIERILDFGDLPVFEEATTYPSIISMVKKEPTSIFEASNITTLNFTTTLEDYFINNKTTIHLENLSEDGWSLNNSDVQLVIKKIKSNRINLGNFVESKLFRGILTGFNEAFIIDESTKNELISNDPNSAELIKPFLDGKDIKKYESPKYLKWLILSKNGLTRELFGKLDEQSAWIKFKEKFPSIAEWFLNFEIKLKSRSDQGEFWWELRPCDYYEEFEKSKIVWAETSLNNQFCLIEGGTYLNKTSFLMSSSDKALLAILNSTLVRFYLDSIVSKVRGGYFSMSKAYVETIPIIYPENPKPLVELASQIIEIKINTPKSDTSNLEKDIDQLVYQLYDLSEEEIKIVEGR